MLRVLMFTILHLFLLLYILFKSIKLCRYFCEKWGVSNYTTWLKFSEHGYTNALVTEHEGTCAYSPQHRRCPLPAKCATSTGSPHQLVVPAGVTRAAKSKLIQQFLQEMQSCTENVYQKENISLPV